MSKAAGNALTLSRPREDRRDPTLPAILEFQWPSTAIVNAPVPRSARSVVWIVSSMVMAFVIAMGVIPVDQVVTARGIVVSQAPTVLVQPLETAIVRSIDVREGQEVKAGDLLARLDPTFAAADVAALEAQVTSLEAEVARLEAESEGKPFVYSGTDANWPLQAAIYGHRKAQFDAKVENYDRRMAELSAAIARSTADAAAYRQRLGVAQSIEDMRKRLQTMQVGSKLNSLVALDSRIEMERALSSAEQTAEEAKRNREAVGAERDSYVRGWQADVSQMLSQARGKANEAREQLAKAKLRRQLVEQRSDVDAIVQSVAKVSVGSVMQSGQQLITLVPVNVPLEIEANISGRDSGFVHLDDPVAIKFDTFPYSQYGMAEGKVRIVSPDSFTPQVEARNPTSTVPVVGTTEPFYRGRIAIERVALHDVPEGFRVIPGMPVTADIKVGRRTILQYLFGLVLPIAREAMREP
jgi:HlyD family secretion protein